MVKVHGKRKKRNREENVQSSVTVEHLSGHSWVGNTLKNGCNTAHCRRLNFSEIQAVSYSKSEHFIHTLICCQYLISTLCSAATLHTVESSTLVRSRKSEHLKHTLMLSALDINTRPFLHKYWCRNAYIVGTNLYKFTDTMVLVIVRWEGGAGTSTINSEKVK